MTATQPPLWRDGWDIEPCDDSTLDPGLTAYLNQLACSGDARAAGGRRRWVYLDKPIHEIEIKGDLL
ncbi:hypothetical protein [Streptomyces erythrochromogenes]|uniref:hypothetical protein n=1 Tax=Streptomyces erythrochromogenes TaxID=285574 RepID=UPI002256AA65|nr:hypothetical protein [Streptomyces erythrochromogenes]MCX5584247.1 hypothetical protein [Streptomyces erythrochromogenes]